ncbi:hypothetical protein [Vibrio parahaemolyticus]|uniref:hypothetical protein n=1 Tax=Vibrio parahaemolyticus TaxID=670 RepID=UPI00177DF05B|nr:hypothetical protein [Vibrio parahaemolyticus]MBD6979707.1 hypothetical protein [Vibrio parahaemolyticus]
MENGKIFLDKRNKTTYVRKRLWNKDLGKYDQSTILKFANYEQPPQELPGDVIKEHNLTKSEIDQYSELAKGLIDERNAVTKRVTLSLLKHEQPPQELPGDVIKEHNLTKSEIDQYSELAKGLIDERNAVTKRVTLSLLKQNLVDAINATKTVEDVERLGVESLDELADLTNELKKQLNRHKNTLKKRKH